MNPESNGSKVKWYHFRRLGMTEEYCSGIIAGFGLGIVVLVSVARNHPIDSSWTLTLILGFALIAIGSNMHRHIKPQRTKDDNTED